MDALGLKEARQGILLLLNSAARGGGCVGGCVGGWLRCVFYFEIKSTWQCRRSSSEHVGSLSVA